MTLFNMIGSLLIGPLKLLFEVIFSYAYMLLQNPGLAVIVLSLAMNILVLPLYRRADAIQIEARDTENKLKDVATHIKKTFSGDERMMILQTYYRQNNYNPLSVLSGSISLLLEIPFFLAAYQFLSSVGAFTGVAFGPISDLSAPDGLLVIGGFTINALPVLMTLVNVISSSLYLKGFPLKTKIQLYGMALFFLVFLYNSPAALVFYWTLNNTFSLVKTLFYRIKHSKIILNVLLSLVGIGAILLAFSTNGIKIAFFIILGIVAQLPWLLPLLMKRLPHTFQKNSETQPNAKSFVLGVLFLTVLVGLLIPSTYISASPQEYIDTNYFFHPVWYIVQTLCLSAGTFLVWFSVFYWLANPRGKVIFSRLVWVLSGIMLANYMFFGTQLGVLSPDLFYVDGFAFANSEVLLNLIVVVALFAVLYLIAAKFPKAISTVLLIGAISLTCMSVLNITKTVNATEETKLQISNSSEQLPSFTLSQDGQNVVMIMLDRGIGPFVPFIMEECPELEEALDGFTYYSNTLSHGAYTNFGAPALYGGYEYIPVNMNLRDSELLVDKHNEALKVLPTLFSEEGYDVTVIDPSYANYQWIPDISIYDNLPGVDAYIADGKFNDLDSRIQTIDTRMRNFFFFSLMKTLPVSVQNSLYDGGLYHKVPGNIAKNDTSSVYSGFMSAYHVLNNMSNITQISSGDENTFMFIRSNFTHEPVIMQEPDYEPSSYIDNSAYYSEAGKTITAGNRSYLLDDGNKIAHYHTNLAALKKLANWFDYLRENDVYDNTRIIIVSDHGRDLYIFDQDEIALHDIDYYLPMLMVKDFDSHGFTTVDDFMTNADAPVLAVADLFESAVNPYTGVPIDSSYKLENETQYVIVSDLYSTAENCGYQFLPSEWAAVSGEAANKDNWTFYTDLSIFPPELSN